MESSEVDLPIMVDGMLYPSAMQAWTEFFEKSKKQAAT
jgi:hypothetical protein